MALNQLGLGFLFTAKDAASGTVNALRSNVSRLGMTTKDQGMMMQKAMIGVGAATAVMGAGIGGLVVAKGAADAFGKFEQSLAAVKAVTKASTQEYALLKDAAIQAGIETQFSPDEATQGLLSLATAGQTATQSTKTLIPVLDLAAGSLGQLGVAEAAEAVVGSLNSYQMSADQAASTTDKLLRITQISNFQTRDFATGLAKAASAGAVFKQNFDDVLITMGLIRNANIDASSAATGFREATRRIATDKRAQQALEKFGVSVFDSNGAIRQGIDVMGDFADQLKTNTDKESLAAVTTAFGARGMLAFNAVSKATFTTMKDGKEVVLKGSAAVKAMREEMGKAGGTAKSFREQLLDTYEGQKTLLKGTMETLAITSGEAFSDIFRPIVTSVTNFLNVIIKAIKNTPAPVKKLVGGLILVVSTFVALAGAGAFIAATIALLAPILKIAAVGFAVMSVAMLPVLVLFGGIALAVQGFRVAVDKNVGGIADRFSSTWSKIKLGAQALWQFFSEGKISGAIAKDLTKAENQGVLAFVNRTVAIFSAIQKFFGGIVKGFGKSIERMGPAFDKLFAAFERLGKALGFLGEDEGADQAKNRMDKFAAAGERTGMALARAFEGIVNGITAVVDWLGRFTEATKGVDAEMKVSKGILGIFADQMLNLGDAASGASKDLDSQEKKVSKLHSAIQLLTTVVNVGAVIMFSSWATAATGLRIAVGTIRGLFDILMGALQVVFGGFSVFWGDGVSAAQNWASGIKRIVMGVIKILATLAKATNSIAKALGLGFDEAAFDQRISELDQGLARDLGIKGAAGEQTFVAPSKRGQFGATATVAAPTSATTHQQLMAAQRNAPVLASVAEAAAVAGDTPGGASLQQFVASMQGALQKQGSPQITIHVTSELDGEVIASKIESRGGADSSFTPGGAPAGS